MQYQKTEKSVAITTLGGSSANGDAYALMELEEKQTIRADKIVPFHAVEKATVTVTTVEKTKSDPYFCEEGGSADRVGSAIVGQSIVGG